MCLPDRSSSSLKSLHYWWSSPGIQLHPPFTSSLWGSSAVWMWLAAFCLYCRSRGQTTWGFIHSTHWINRKGRQAGRDEDKQNISNDAYFTFHAYCHGVLQGQASSNMHMIWVYDPDLPHVIILSVQVNVERRLFSFRFGEPQARMNWVHVDNLVQAHTLAAEALKPKRSGVAVSFTCRRTVIHAVLLVMWEGCIG